MATTPVRRKRKAKPKPRAKGKASSSVASGSSPGTPGLPTEKKKPDTDLLRYTLLLYGREKIGKTTFLASFPDALFLTTEPGSKGQEIFEYNSEDGGCKNWPLIEAAVDLLEKTDRFRTVVIDTVDRAYDLCLDQVCKDLRIPYPGKDSSGQEDYGKSWKEVKQRFLTLVHRILQTGRGLCFTSHAKEQEIKTRSGDKYTRIFPSMGNQARSVVEALVDLFFYVEYMKVTGEPTRRVIITEGDEVIWAGAREVGVTLPRFIPMTKKGGFDILQAAFAGEEVGLDPTTLIPVRGASEAVKKFVRDSAKQGAVKSPRGEGKPPAKKKKKKKVMKRKSS